MFQAQRILPEKCRPVILHGYGGAKLHMPDGLEAVSVAGWRPAASAMVGTEELAPMWTGDDWRPIVGTSVDSRLLPTPLTEREELLLLSMWLSVPRDSLSLFHSANTWLSRKKDIPARAGPDRADSPHSPEAKEPHEWWRSEYFKPMFKAFSLENRVEMMITLRIMADTMTIAQLRQLTSILLGGAAPSCFNRREWLEVVRDSLDQSPLAIHTRAQLRLVVQMVNVSSYYLSVATNTGQVLPASELPSLTQGTDTLPHEWLTVLILSKDAATLPPVVRVDCTGLGGHDLGGPHPYHLCIRSDKHGQGVYGPSVAALEAVRYDHRNKKTAVAMGRTKAMHEFLVLHYFAIDSASGWDSFLTECLPQSEWVRSATRRATLMNMFDVCHIPPSHRRFAHQSWASSLHLLLDLILGSGKARYLCSGHVSAPPVEVVVRGFSAGSFSGLCLCHILWRMSNVTVKGTLGGIAVPPALLMELPEMQGRLLTLFHLTADALCQWDPSGHLLNSLSCQCCIVGNETTELHGHFGTGEHSYGHWLDLDLPIGRFELLTLLRKLPDLANPAFRDAAPLRLVSRLSCEVPPPTQCLLDQLMEAFAAIEPVSSKEVFELSCKALTLDPVSTTTWDQIRDAIISSIAIGSRLAAPPAVVNLMSSFLRRLPLPRLVHFLDMILPQLVPVRSPSRTAPRRFCSSYLVEEMYMATGEVALFRLRVCHLFWSRANVTHVCIAWDHHPLLLLSAQNIPGRSTASFQWEIGAAYDRSKIQMGLRKGATVLLHFRRGLISSASLCCSCTMQNCDKPSRIRTSTSTGDMSPLPVPISIGSLRISPGPFAELLWMPSRRGNMARSII